jgi:hypothetical protein
VGSADGGVIGTQSIVIFATLKHPITEDADKERYRYDGLDMIISAAWEE